ncbi:MAG: hypothetical protein Kow00108_11370 [Calditrichia bacterium]
MAESVYISKNLTRDQARFLQLLRENEIEYFTIHRIEQDLGVSFSNIHEILENLEKKGFLRRIQKGYYVDAQFNNPYVIGTFISRDGAVAYWTALNLHGLTEQIPNIIYIQTPFRKRDTVIFGVSYKFVTITGRKRAGIITMGYGNHAFNITDPEKTIVDCFDLPQYSGGMDVLIASFAKAELNPDKLMEYAEKINNLAAIKRMGYLAEVLQKNELQPFIQYSQSKLNERYNLLDPFGEDTGKYLKRWKIRLNLTENQIIQMAKGLY